VLNQKDSNSFIEVLTEIPFQSERIANNLENQKPKEDE
jgi:hypothetical protein